MEKDYALKLQKKVREQTKTENEKRKASQPVWVRRYYRVFYEFAGLREHEDYNHPDDASRRGRQLSNKKGYRNVDVLEFNVYSDGHEVPREVWGWKLAD